MFLNLRNIIFFSFIFILCSCGKNDSNKNDLNIIYSSYRDTNSNVEDILRGEARYSSKDYVIKISNLSETAFIRCGSSNTSGRSYAYGNRPTSYEDSRDGTGGTFQNRVITRSELGLCAYINSESKFEFELKKLKKMTEAFRICGDINVDGTQKLIDDWNKCTDDIYVVWRRNNKNKI